MKIGILLGTIPIPLLGIVFGIIYMNDPSPAKKQAGKLWLWTGVGMLALSCICGLISFGMAQAQ